MSAIAYDEDTAKAEGWTVCVYEREDRLPVPMIICEGDAFSSHREALCFVATQAAEKEGPHRAVMDAIYAVNPAEFWDGMSEANRLKISDTGALLDFVEKQARPDLYAAVREWEELRHGGNENGTLMGLARGFVGEAGFPAGRDPMELMGQIIALTRNVLAMELDTEFAFADEDDVFPERMLFPDMMALVNADLLDVQKGEHGGEIPSGLYVNEVQPSSEVLLATKAGEEKVWVQGIWQVNRDSVLAGRYCEGVNAGKPVAFQKRHVLDFAESSPFNERRLRDDPEITF